MCLHSVSDRPGYPETCVASISPWQLHACIIRCLGGGAQDLKPVFFSFFLCFFLRLNVYLFDPRVTARHPLDGTLTFCGAGGTPARVARPRHPEGLILHYVTGGSAHIQREALTLVTQCKVLCQMLIGSLPPTPPSNSTLDCQVQC